MRPRRRASRSSGRRRRSWSCSGRSTRLATRPARWTCRCSRAPACWRPSTRRSRRRSAIGYPVMLKATAGGGGIGMRACTAPDELVAAWEAVRRTAGAAFGSAGVYLERLITAARHVEVQVFGDGLGRVVTLGDRDCSLQRRHQKVVEEAPAPRLPDEVRALIASSARTLAESVDYRSAGTVEFVYDAVREEAAFLEVNTRLQVEHPVTEAVFGVDLVAWMIRLAQGDTSVVDTPLQPRGAAVEARVYAENPDRDHLPSAGTITAFEVPDGVRVDTWIEPGVEVSTHYDPLLAKVIAAGDGPRERLGGTRRRAREHPADGHRDERRAAAHDRARPRGRRRAAPHRHARAPARRDAAHRGAASGHAHDRPGLARSHGPVARRHPAVGADGRPVVPAGQHRAGQPRGRARPGVHDGRPGAPVRHRRDGHGDRCTGRGHARRRRPSRSGSRSRSRRAACSRIGAPATGHAHVPAGQRAVWTSREVLGSRRRSTSAASAAPRASRCGPGDQLAIGAGAGAADPSPRRTARTSPSAWQIGALEGPHAAPEFFTPGDVAEFYATTWAVHFNSARTGVRLVGPKPTWARPDGGEAGLHPSNIHDTPYAVGAVDYTGDLPILLGPDGPSLGGFTCPATVALGQLWKLGQLRPGDTVRFVPVDEAEADALRDPRPQATSRHPDGPRRRRHPRAQGHDTDPTRLTPPSHLPPQRRRQPARRVRGDDPRPGAPGCGCTRSRSRCRTASTTTGSAASSTSRRASARCSCTSTPIGCRCGRPSTWSGRSRTRCRRPRTSSCPAAPCTCR